MTYWDAVILGLVQGLTEFLPISSSGHLVLVQHLMGLNQLLPFDVLVHFSTLIAVLVYYRREVANMAVAPFFPSRVRGARRLLVMIIIASIPTALVGLAYQNFLTGLFESPAAVGLFWLVTAALLFAASRLREGFDMVERLAIPDALLIGLFQGIAILPGVSRSGATIAAGVLCGLRPKEAANFSFLLAIPAVLGATILEAKDLEGIAGDQLSVYIVGAVVAMLSGYAAIWMLLKLLHRRIILPFAWYCVGAGLFAWIALK
jgi:undecaprenyl-diphosphatase